MKTGEPTIVSIPGLARQRSPRWANPRGRGRASDVHERQGQAESQENSAHRPTAPLGTWAEQSLSSDTDPRGEKKKAEIRRLCSESLEIGNQLPRWGGLLLSGPDPRSTGFSFRSSPASPDRDRILVCHELALWPKTSPFLSTGLFYRPQEGPAGLTTAKTC